MSDSEKKIELFGVYVAQTMDGFAPALVLKSKEKYLPIYVGLSEAISTNNKIKDYGTLRPIAHDLIMNFLERKGFRISKVLIDNLEDGIYFAQLYLKNGDSIKKIDARPSDSIALAVRGDVDIFIKESILDEASRDKREIENNMKLLDEYL